MKVMNMKKSFQSKKERRTEMKKSLKEIVFLIKSTEHEYQKKKLSHPILKIKCAQLPMKSCS